MSYQGDFTTANTVYVYFNTFDSNDPSASVTLTGLAVTDIEVYKDGSITQRASDAGFTLLDTDGIDFDSNIGIHGFSVDLSDNTDAGFYAAGSEYSVVIASITVDAATVNFIAATFSIERAGGAIALLKGTNSLSDIEGKIDTIQTDLDNGTDGLGAIKTDTAAILVDTTEIGAAGAGLTDITLNAASIDLVWDEVLTGGTHNVINSSGRRLRQLDAAFEVHAGTAQAGTATTITLDTGASATDDIYNGDRIVIAVGTGAQEHGIVIDYDGTTKVATMSKAWVVTPDVTSEFVVVPADCDVETWNHNVVTDDGDWAALKAETALIVADTGELQTDWVDGGRLDLIQDIIAADTTTDIPALIGTSQADLDIITGADGVNLLSGTQTSIDAIETDTGTTIPGTITTLQADTDDIQTRLPAALIGGRMDSDVEAINAVTAAAVNLSASAQTIVPAVCEGTPTTTVIQTDLAETTDDHYIGRIAIFISGAAAFQASDITDYTGSTGTITVTALTTAPAASDTLVIV